MGTRSIIMVKGTNDLGQSVVHRLYKHWDGYPSDTLKMIGQAIGDSRPVNPVVQFVHDCERFYQPEMIEETFINIPFNLEMFGNQGDLEWMYTVDLDSKVIKVFTVNGTPQQAFKLRGPIDPFIEINQWKTEFQLKCAESLQETIEKIKSLNFKIARVA